MGGAEQHERAGERPSLYVVATPIGNLADVTLRALEVLKRVAVIAAEDTRVTARLLDHYGIATPLIALHEHNERRAAQQILRHLARGGSVALVSDAGTPAVSDPGALAVRLVREAGYPVVPVPGANAALAALAAAGSPARHFLIYGFLPAQAAARRRELEALRDCPQLIAFYEAPHRVVASINDLVAVFGGERTITVARELTKVFESIHVCRLDAAAAWIAADPNRARGEFVLLVEGAGQAAGDAMPLAQRALDVLARELPPAQAARLAAKISGARKSEIYALALQTKKKR